MRKEWGTAADPRERALRGLLVATVFLTAVLFAVNLRLEAVGLAAVNALSLLVCVVSLLALRASFPRTVLALAYLSAVSVNIGATLAEPHIQPGTASSLALIPVLCYLLLDGRLALPLTLVSLVAAMGAYFAGAGVEPSRLNPRQVAHVLVPVIILLVLCHVYSLRRQSDFQRLLERASRDPLTGLGNREKLMRAFTVQQQRARRDRTPLSLILIDLDRFKAVNDRFGHEAGDAALAFFAGLMRHRLRDADVACRIGGEEFAVLLPTTDLSGATAIAEDLRRTLAASLCRHGQHRIGMTLSAGAAEFGRDGDEWPLLYRAADARLYDCKVQGRNRVFVDAVQKS